jgi:hypothetical protein
MEAAAWGLIGTVVGALASISATWISARNAFSLQGQAAHFEREEKHRSFQHSTLVELQDAVHDLIRLWMRGHLEDQAAFAETQEWGAKLLSEEVDEGIRLGISRVQILKERVADDGLRDTLDQLLSLVADHSITRTRAGAERLYATLIATAPRVMEEIGQSLRSQYAPPQLSISSKRRSPAKPERSD